MVESFDRDYLERLIVVATTGDPRSQSGAIQVERRCVKSRIAACRLAGKWTYNGYWISVYTASGECVLEVPLA